MYKLINTIKILNYKGNIYKYKLQNLFTQKGIRDFYFTDVKFGFTKGWKFKEIKTIIIPIKGKVIFMIKKKKNSNFIKIKLSSSDKKILVINKKTYFCFKSVSRKGSTLLSFLNNKYND